MITRNAQRDYTDAFKDQVCGWIRESGEVFAVLRYLCGAGSKDYLFCRSEQEFLSLLDRVPEGTDTIIFKNPQLPLRGLCTGGFSTLALEQIPDGMEYLICRLHAKHPFHLHHSGRTGETQASLLEDLEEFAGTEVTVGPCPDFIAPDNSAMISASKRGLDGPR